jgi:N-acetylmuramoyl-L-alanine amidase
MTKNKYLSFIFIILSSFLLIACNDDDNSDNTSSPPATTSPPSTSSPSTTTSKAPDYIISENYQVDTTYLSPNQDARQMILVLHYTALPLEETLRRFMSEDFAVSSHYLIPEQASNQKFTVYNLVPDDKRAWHAGVSYWQGNRNLNPSSIGIEIINLGFPEADENLPLMQRRWYPYQSKQQIDVLAEVIKKVVDQYKITPTRIVAHSDIAPGRKFDPGPLFPWKQLYTDHGIGAWYDDDTVNFYRQYSPWNNDIQILQTKLSSYGYDVPSTGINDQETQNAVAAFQMHFYPEKYDGIADVETVARLDALLEKYRGQQRPSL